MSSSEVPAARNLRRAAEGSEAAKLSCLNSSRRFCLAAESLLIVEAESAVLDSPAPASGGGAATRSAIASLEQVVAGA